MINFNDLPWHDAVLLKVIIDRENPGNRDEVEVIVRWPDSTINKIIFTDCYMLEAAMNFGIVAEESILNAEVLQDTPQIDSLKKMWSQSGGQVEEIKCFQINTNSTNSVIKIYAKQLTLEPQ